MRSKPNTRCVIPVMVCIVGCSGTRQTECAGDIAARRWKAALESCQCEFAKTHDLARANDAAKAALYLGRPPDTVRLATPALNDPATAPDAHALLGSAQLMLGESRSAASHLTEAAQLHGAAGNARAQSRDYQQLAGVYYRHGEIGRA